MGIATSWLESQLKSLVRRIEDLEKRPARSSTAVVRGERSAGSVKPYAVWQLAFSGAVPGATVDGAGCILVSEDHGDSAFPLIHVFEV